MMVIGAFLPPFSGRAISDAGAEGFKISTSALVGALSAIIGTNSRGG